ncbi:ATP synthase mitochondrial F1 complex assembly factor 2 isoform X2 [Procambarus clarkii]|uniref:ATP synthase mitochondrial F1 complex assembly factor 2 isoform X2 n=1 Tax=Procambarus clarkii TaxID=6728 RepID=UPI0037428286
MQSVRSEHLAATTTTARKRFYRNVTVAGANSTYEINLDHRKLKTPLGNILQVPNYGLALAVANEWAAIKNKIHPSLLHLTALANTVIDNPNHESKWNIVDKTVKYLETDTLLFRDNGTEAFIEMQAKEWDPVLDWFNTKFEMDLKPCDGIIGPDIPSSARERLRRYLLSYDIWAGNGFLYGVEALKSVILTIAATERKISSEKAVYLSRLETNFQTSYWGPVEWAHDLDKYDLEARFSAALLFIYFNTYQGTLKQKAEPNRH